MKTMKILWLAAHPHPREGSPGIPWIATLLDQLAARPADLALTVLSPCPALGAPSEHLDRAGVHYIYLDVPPQRQDILSLYRRRVATLTAYVRAHHHEYDLIHVHGSEYQLHAAAVGLTTPVVLSVQGIVWEYLKVLPTAEPTRRFLWLLASYYELRYLPRLRNVLCRTTWDTAQSRRHSPGCQVYHNWEMLRPLFYKLDALAAPKPARPHLLFLGGTQVLKGYREALEAFNLIRQQIPAKLILVGQTQPEVVQRYIKRRRLTAIGPDDLELRGMQSTAQLQPLLLQAQCLLHPSYIDNSPNSVCEAQLIGLPVVATLVGGVGSLIEHERTGLAARLDPRDLAAQVLRLCRDEPLRQRIAQEARRVARVRHDPATITQRTIDTYRSILAREKPAAGTPATTHAVSPLFSPALS